MSNLLAQLETLNSPTRTPSRAEEIARAEYSAQQRAWHQEWARRCREVSHARHAAEAKDNDALVLAALQGYRGPVSTRDLASSMHRSQDWLRKHVLPRLVKQGKVRAVVVTHPTTGWPIRRDWEAA